MCNKLCITLFYISSRECTCVDHRNPQILQFYYSQDADTSKLTNNMFRKKWCIA